MSKQTGIYLGQATREVEYKLGYYNSIIAPVGSGKSTYAEGKLLDELDNNNRVREGLTVILAPFNSVVSQIEDGKVYGSMTEIQKTQLKGMELISGDVMLQSDDKIVLTPQSFFVMLHNEFIENGRSFRKGSKIMDNIRAIIIDEADFIFGDLIYWDKDENGDVLRDEENPYVFAAELFREYSHEIMIIGITATGEEVLEDMFYGIYHRITFTEKLKQQQFELEEEYSSLRVIFNEATKDFSKNDKVAIYMQRVTAMVKEKEYLESLGYKVCLITADYPKHYKPTIEERMVKQELSTSRKEGDVMSKTFYDEGYDVMIFNTSIERGVSIYDKNFKSVIIHDSREVTQIQAVGRFRFDGLRKYVLANAANRTHHTQVNVVVDKQTGVVTSDIIIPDKWLDVALTNELKNELIKDIQFSRKWPSLKKELIEQGYNIQDTQVRIDGKRPRVSIIIK